MDICLTDLLAKISTLIQNEISSIQTFKLITDALWNINSKIPYTDLHRPT